MRLLSPLFPALFLGALLALAACSKPAPPQGKWEGGYAQNGTIIVARVEIGADALVRVSAPNIGNLQNAKPEQFELERDRLAAELASNWDSVEKRPFNFDGKTFRKPGGHAPQMEWNKATNQMTVILYIGANPGLPVPLRPVDGFHDNPFPHA